MVESLHLRFVRHLATCHDLPLFHFLAYWLPWQRSGEKEWMGACAPQIEFQRATGKSNTSIDSQYACDKYIQRVRRINGQSERQTSPAGGKADNLFPLTRFFHFFFFSLLLSFVVLSSFVCRRRQLPALHTSVRCCANKFIYFAASIPPSAELNCLHPVEFGGCVLCTVHVCVLCCAPNVLSCWRYA